MQLENEPERLVDVECAPTQSSVFLVEIQVEALDRKSLLSDVTRILPENHVNIPAAIVPTSSARLALSRFAFDMAAPKSPHPLLLAVGRIRGVLHVHGTPGSPRRCR